MMMLQSIGTIMTGKNIFNRCFSAGIATQFPDQTTTFMKHYAYFAFESVYDYKFTYSLVTHLFFFMGVISTQTIVLLYWGTFRLKGLFQNSHYFELHTTRPQTLLVIGNALITVRYSSRGPNSNWIIKGQSQIDPWKGCWGAHGKEKKTLHELIKYWQLRVSVSEERLS